MATLRDHAEAFLALQPLDLLVVDGPALTAGVVVGASVTPAGMLARVLTRRANSTHRLQFNVPIEIPTGRSEKGADSATPAGRPTMPSEVVPSEQAMR